MNLWMTGGEGGGGGKEKRCKLRNGCGPTDVLVCLESILTIEKQSLKLFPYQMYHMWGINESNGQIFSADIYKFLGFGFYYLLLLL